MTYYNDIDPWCCAWLRELIAEGLIPHGEVDNRSILYVKPHELTRYTQQHFFAGIGGWALALRLAGWPDDAPVRTGSCPCQPFSQAGKQLGTKDERHLWPVFRDLITFGEATITFGEQVASPLGRQWLAGVRVDLEGLGYAVGAEDLCAASVGAPHIRQRLYWVAHANAERRRPKLQLEKREGEWPRKQSGRDSGLGHANGRGRQSRPETSQAARYRNTTGSNGGAGRVGNTESIGNRTSSDGGSDSKVERERRECFAGGSSSPCGLVDSQSEGRTGVESECESRLSERSRTGSASAVERMANGVEPRLEGHARDERNGSEPGRLGAKAIGSTPTGSWSSYDVLDFRDNKRRRVESGSFPLVARLPRGVVPSCDPSVSYAQATAEFRIQRLKGYGNSIVPELAAEFIRASVEAIICS